MSADEARRQRALVQAVLSGQFPAGEGLRGLPGVEGAGTRGLSAYRVNAQGSSARALAAIYPRLQHAMGEDEFAAMAWGFWRQHPPLGGDLGCFGQSLADFLQAQAEMPLLLPHCARLEWAAHAAERAADAHLDADSLQALADQDPATLRVRFRPGLSLHAVTPAAATLWRADLPCPDDARSSLAPMEQSGGAPVGAARVDTAQAQAGALCWVLIWRHQWQARGCLLGPAQACFMQQLTRGVSLQQALEQTLDAHPSFDFSAWLQASLREAWLWDVLSLRESSR